MTVADVERRPAGPTRSQQMFGRDNLRLLGYWLLGGVGLAIVTSPQGRLGQPSYAIRQAFHPGHLAKSVAVAVVLWLIVVAWRAFRDDIGPPIASSRAIVGAYWQRPIVRYAFYAALLAFAILFPWLKLGNYWQGVLVEQIGIYALLAIGLNIVVGFAGLLDLGYIAFYAIGAYTTAYFTGTLPVQPPFIVNPFYAIPLATIAAMTAGLILGAPTLRLRGDYLAIVTLGFGEIVTILAVNMDSITRGSRGAFGIPSFNIHALGIDYDFGLGNLSYYYLLLTFLVIVLILFSQLENSRIGRAWTAIREDEVAAQAVGIAPVRYKLMAFAIGASTSGFAGALYASKIGFINPSSFTITFSILVLVIVIFGGMGSLAGSVVGAVVLQTVFAHIREHNGVRLGPIKLDMDPADIYIYVGALLIIMMIFRPQGIVPSRRRAREIGLAEHGVGGADAMGGSTLAGPTA
jgi:branched-chain amino acid transport system permease protein